MSPPASCPRSRRLQSASSHTNDNSRHTHTHAWKAHRSSICAPDGRNAIALPETHSERLPMHFLRRIRSSVSQGMTGHEDVLRGPGLAEGHIRRGEHAKGFAGTMKTKPAAPRACNPSEPAAQTRDTQSLLWEPTPCRRQQTICFLPRAWRFTVHVCNSMCSTNYGTTNELWQCLNTCHAVLPRAHLRRFRRSCAHGNNDLSRHVQDIVAATKVDSNMLFTHPLAQTVGTSINAPTPFYASLAPCRHASLRSGLEPQRRLWTAEMHTSGCRKAR